MTNPAFALQTMAQSQPDSLALLYSDYTLSYAQLWQTVQAFAVKMREQGVDRSSLVSVETQDVTVSIAALLATGLLGARFSTASQEEIGTEFTAVTHPFRTNDVDELEPETRILIDASWSPADALERFDARFPGFESPDDPWMLAHTSGTTGYPKFLYLTEAMMEDRTIAASVDFSPTNTRFASLFPCTAYPYLTRVLSVFRAGRTVVTGTDTAFWRESQVSLVMASPYQISGKFGEDDLFQKFPSVHIGGAKLAERDVKNLLKYFETVVDIYGASETNRSYQNIISLTDSGEVETIGRMLDSKVEILDENNLPCGLGEPGRVRVQNPYLVKGYLNNDAATEKSFRDGWFYSGDTAYFDGNNALNILGREDHILNLGGTKVNALAIDSIIRTVDGIEDAICFANPKPEAAHTLLAFAVFDDSRSQLQLVETAKYQIRKKLGDSSVPVNIRPIDRVPRLAGGAPDRAGCEELVRQRIAAVNKRAE